MRSVLSDNGANGGDAIMILGSTTQIGNGGKSRRPLWRRESAAYSGEHVAGGRGSTVKWGQLDRGRHCGDGIGTGAGNDDILPGKIFQYSTINKKETS